MFSFLLCIIIKQILEIKAVHDIIDAQFNQHINVHNKNSIGKKSLNYFRNS